MLSKEHEIEIIQSNLKVVEGAIYGATIRHRVAKKIDDKESMKKEVEFLEKMEKMKMEYEEILNETLKAATQITEGQETKKE